MTLVWLFLVKHWKEAAILLIVITGVWWIRGKDVKIAKLEREIHQKDAKIAALSVDYTQLQDLNQQRNDEIERLGVEAQEREERLAAALARPPKIIYRDRIVEVPSIHTEPCEQVVVDIHHYIERILQ